MPVDGENICPSGEHILVLSRLNATTVTTLPSIDTKSNAWRSEPARARCRLREPAPACAINNGAVSQGSENVMQALGNRSHPLHRQSTRQWSV